MSFNSIKEINILRKETKLGRNEKNKTKLEFLIRSFMFRHLFPSCFSTNETPEKLANAFGSDQKRFC